MGKRFVVGMKDTETSIETLRWALAMADQEDAELVVVHAASLAIAVRNGPSRAVAFKMGDPLWATIYSTVNGFAPPAGTVTVVEGGRAVDVLAKHAEPGDTIVLGPSRRRWLRSRSTQLQLRALGYDVRVVEAGHTTSDPAGPNDSTATVHPQVVSSDMQPTTAPTPGDLSSSTA